MVKVYFEKIKELGIGKLVLIFFAGILLVLSATMDETPKENGGEPAQTMQPDVPDTELAASMEEILGKIEGVTRVSVCITYEDTGEKILVSSKETQVQKVTQQDAQGGNKNEESQNISEEYLYEGETPYVIMEKKPTICGVLVVYEGDKSKVSDISEAVKVLTGVDYNRIKVLSMN